MEDVFKTIGKEGEGFYSEKRSKFLAFSHHVETEAQVKNIIAMYRKKYYDARHVCYAYVIGVDGIGDGVLFRMNDDGEPSSTAGKPIYGQLVKADLTDTLIVVVRYYGGVNLGTSGLMVAYREAALDCINNSLIEERIIEERVEYTFSYPMMNDVMRVVKDLQPRIVSQQFDNTCSITLAIRKSLVQQLKSRLEQLVFK
ncbi:MAG: YigZ family protein [Bacteroidales bacterium]|nr:YigZ family protein [Bacteroidales bacterium]MCM1148387.1 YigZ family protein [Bacteroidales bacterium]MCM1207134.1 YigZ family protein [Bacillota bacterium]MCM1511367.1 YigZ family protein [Clostridium sp.]